MNAGIYQLLIELPGECRIRIGGLGQIDFKKGRYIYTGSARANLRQRLARHYALEKNNFWHIDYLLEFADIVAYSIRPYAPGLECTLNRNTIREYSHPGLIAGFGCSDCVRGCVSHLLYCGESKPLQASPV